MTPEDSVTVHIISHYKSSARNIWGGGLQVAYTYCGYEIGTQPGRGDHAYYALGYVKEREEDGHLCPECEASPDLALKLLSDLP